MVYIGSRSREAWCEFSLPAADTRNVSRQTLLLVSSARHAGDVSTTYRGSSVRRQVQIRMTEPGLAQIDAKADEFGMTRTDLIRAILRQALAEPLWLGRLKPKGNQL